MSKTLYPPSVKPIFAVENTTAAQAQAIYDWALENGVETCFMPHEFKKSKYFGSDIDFYTWCSNNKVDFKNNILTFAEFAELAGVEVKP